MLHEIKLVLYIPWAWALHAPVLVHGILGNRYRFKGATQYENLEDKKLVKLSL